MDKLRDVIERALKDNVLVVKTDGKFLKNPSLSVIKKLFNEKLAMKFRKILGPDTEEKFKYIQEIHARGASIHIDMRWTLGEGKVAGITIARPFGLPNASEWKAEIDKAATKILDRAPQKELWRDVKPAQKHKIRAELEKAVKPWFFIDPFLKKHLPDFLNWNRKHVFIPKPMQDMSWFEQPYTVIPPGFVGSTVLEWSALVPFDEGEIEFGVIKPDYMECFIYSKDNIYNGKLSMIFLPREQVEASLPDMTDEGKLGKELWVGFVFTNKTSMPYMLTDRAIEEDFMPDPGMSALPKAIRKALPKDCRYWEDGDKTKRDNAVEWARKNVKPYTRKDANDVPKKGELWEL